MITTLNGLKEVLMRKSSWGYELVFARSGQIRVFVHRKEFAYLESYMKGLIHPSLAKEVEFKKQSRIWDIKMWWRSL